jgi:hypothetical protein
MDRSGIRLGRSPVRPTPCSTAHLLFWGATDTGAGNQGCEHNADLPIADRGGRVLIIDGCVSEAPGFAKWG